VKILITGAAGFIGYHVTKKLLQRGDRVVGIDSINDYYDVSLKYARLADNGISHDAEQWHVPVQSSVHPGYTFIRMNLEDRSELTELFEQERFDMVCNLAAQAGVRYSLENPYAYISSNLVGFINILEACRHNKVQHLVYASSSSVYGNNTKMPLSTSDNVDHPISLYAATKKSNELMAHTYSHLFGLPTTGLRFFTVYGPWGRPDMALFLFTKAIIENNPIQVFNNGHMVRDFTYIDDIVEGITRVLDNPPEGKEHRAESTEHRAEGTEQRAEGREQRAEGKEQRAQSTGPRAKSEEQGAQSIGQRAESKEQREERREQGAEGRGQRAQGTEHRAESTEQGITNNQIQATSNQQQVTSNQQPATSTQQQATSAPYAIYNIGNSSPVPLMDYIGAIENHLGKIAEKIFLPMQPGDVPRTEADVSDLIEDMGYKPDTPVEVGIGKFLEWYQSFFNEKADVDKNHSPTSYTK
jgi:UDP-glucuronate 4-epimerase